MRFLRTLRLRAGWWLRRQEAESDLADELRDYVERQTERHLARGLSQERARTAALREVGGVEQLKEGCRDVRRLGWLEDAGRDLAYGAHTLWQAPGFTLTAVLALALCMGAITAIFAVVNAVLFRPLGLPEPDRLVFATEGLPALGFPAVQFACPDYLFVRAHARSFASMAAYENHSYEISGAGYPRRATGARATASLFQTLEVKPAVGRTFTQAEDEDAKQVVVLASGFANSLFGSPEKAVGRTVRIDRLPYTVIGVMPPSFSFPYKTRFENEAASFYVPISWDKKDRDEAMNNYNYSTIARLRAGVKISQAQAELQALLTHLPETYPADIKVMLKSMPNFMLDSKLVPLRAEVTGDVKRPLLLLLGAVGMVMLIGCADVANLVFSRMLGRQREFAVRAALGASRGRLIRQSLTEGLILSMIGGALGVAGAFSGLPVLLHFVPGNLPRANEIGIDGRVLLFALGIVLATPLLAALIPTLYLLPKTIVNRLRESGRSGMQGKQQRGFMSVAVITQFSLAFVLLAAAGLFIRSFLKASESNPGFEAEHVLSVPIQLPLAVYRTAGKERDFYSELLAAVSKLPGLRRAGMISTMPMFYTGNGVITPEGRGTVTERAHMLWSFGNALEALGMRRVRGRLLGPSDDLVKEAPVVISETLAERSWPGQNPIGRRMKQGTLDGSAPWMTVVGVVKDVKEKQASTAPNPMMFMPEAQNEMLLVVRTFGDPRGLSKAIRREAHRLDPSLPVENAQTVDSVLNETLAPERFRTFLLASFAGLALLLSVIGIGGLLSYSTAQRKQEFGVRLALGANRADLAQMVFGQGLKLSVVGIAIGLLASLLVVRVLSGFLYETNGYDPLTFVCVPLVLALVALAASVFPAWRTSRVDPASALKAD